MSQFTATWPPFEGEIENSVDGSVMSGTKRRVRLGVIVPSVNTVVEPWYSAVVPPGVSVHATRMLLADHVTADTLRQMDREEGMASAVRIASCRPDVIAYCCTASSIVQGLKYDAHLQHELQQATGRPCFTAVGAIIDALHTLGARTVSIASPYADSIDHAERLFFEAAGFCVSGTANLGITDGFALASPTPREIYELARRACNDDADVILISCINMNSQTVVDLLERRANRPVITSTTATLWKLLRAAGLNDRIEGYGRLLASH